MPQVQRERTGTKPDAIIDTQAALITGASVVSTDFITSDDMQVLDDLANGYESSGVLDRRKICKPNPLPCDIPQWEATMSNAHSLNTPPLSPDDNSSTPSPHAPSCSRFTSSSPSTSSSITLVNFRTATIRDFTLLKFIGEGACGAVYLVNDNVGSNKLALKVVDKTRLKYDYEYRMLIKEQKTLRKLTDSPWFMTLEASWHDERNFYLAFTYYPTDLASEIWRCGVIGPVRARFYMVEITIALRHLHSLGIIHRDVKPANLLIDRTGHIVLGDFGLSKDGGRSPTQKELLTQPYCGYPLIPEDKALQSSDVKERFPFVSSTYCGTVTEMAPEMHLHQLYSFGVDYWAAAVTLYSMVTGRAPWSYNPYNQKSTDLQIIGDELVFQPYDDVDENCQDFLRKMLMKEPRHRLGAGKSLNCHPYFRGVSWKLMEKRRVAAPWVPGIGTCHSTTSQHHHPQHHHHHHQHLYQRRFVPGREYTSTENPIPEFVYMSERLGGGGVPSPHSSVGTGATKKSGSGTSTGTALNAFLALPKQVMMMRTHSTTATAVATTAGAAGVTAAAFNNIAGVGAGGGRKPLPAVPDKLGKQTIFKRHGSGLGSMWGNWTKPSHNTAVPAGTVTGAVAGGDIQVGYTYHYY
ncbi:hypothetical protein AMATHDRAFT_4107 [Amanita thiersii Skay4041]|uniref:non-specific serine/threonine protein kinase n=1 Tax=Amanita thiersii Skay4041 TaxID=703135 RepID=A0A2A9NPP0_9AGAR|nr:hypothetical protein AMATHDRAFT_4107 [Amanita thiersii Skay4041]